MAPNPSNQKTPFVPRQPQAGATPGADEENSEDDWSMRDYASSLESSGGDKKSSGLTPYQRRQLRLRKPVFFRKTDAKLWLVRRKILRYHRQLPMPVVAGVYLGLAAIICLAIVIPLMRPTAPERPLVQIPPPPKDGVEVLKEASELITDKNYPEAEKRVQELRKIWPDDARVDMAEGALLAGKKDYEGAKRYFERALELKPGSGAAIFNLAEVEFVTGQYAKAQSLYQPISKTMAGNAMITFRLYICAQMLGEKQEAAEIVAKAKTLPQSPEWYYLKAAEAFYGGDNAESRKYVSQARSLYAEKATPFDQTFDRIGIKP